MQKDNKPKGRDLYQQTKDGTTSAGSMGTGATGSTGTNESYDSPNQATGSVGGMQSGGRTDDLLAGGSEAEQNDLGFASGERTGELQTGMSDLGNAARGGANRQSGDSGNRSGQSNQARQENQHGSATGAGSTAADQRDTYRNKQDDQSR